VCTSCAEVYSLRVLLIHNPGAGDEQHDADHLGVLLAKSGHDVDYRSRDDDDWKSALREQRDLVVVAGGDGTVNEVFKELSGSPLAVTLIPLGSANNIAAGLGLVDAEPEGLVAGWRCAVGRPFDVGEATAGLNRRRFVEAAGGGLLAELFRRAEEGRGAADDKIGLGLELLREALERAHPSAWDVGLDGRICPGTSWASRR
jgi:diacylglycerol kinase family enzyme